MEEEIRIDKIICTLKNRWKFITIITLTFTSLAAFLTFFLIEPEYEASTKLFIGKEILATDIANIENDVTDIDKSKGIINSELQASNNYSNSDVELYQNLMKTYAGIIKTRNLVSAALTDNRISLEVDLVLENLTVVTSSDTQILKIQYVSTNPYEAHNVVQSIANTFIAKSKELIANGNIQIIEESNTPQTPISPNNILNISIAFLIGFMVSIGLVLLLESMDTSFKYRDDLEKELNLPVIGCIPAVEE